MEVVNDEVLGTIISSYLCLDNKKYSMMSKYKLPYEILSVNNSNKVMDYIKKYENKYKYQQIEVLAQNIPTIKDMSIMLDVLIEDYKIRNVVLSINNEKLIIPIKRYRLMESRLFLLENADILEEYEIFNNSYEYKGKIIDLDCNTETKFKDYFNIYDLTKHIRDKNLNIREISKFINIEEKNLLEILEKPMEFKKYPIGNKTFLERYEHTDEAKLICAIMFEYLTDKYDYLNSPNVYSCRKTDMMRTMAERLKRTSKNKYKAKINIQPYLDKISFDDLINNLREIFKEETDTLFLKSIQKLVTNTKYKSKGGLKEGTPAIREGCKLSGFVVNYLLRNIDNLFGHKEQLTYIRYDSEIIMMSPDKHLILETIDNLKEKLKLSEKNITYAIPIQPIEFNQFLIYSDATLGISDSTLRKYKTEINQTISNINKQLKENGSKNRLKEMTRSINRYYLKTKAGDKVIDKLFPLYNNHAVYKELDYHTRKSIRLALYKKDNVETQNILPNKAFKYSGMISLQDLCVVYWNNYLKYIQIINDIEEDI